MITAAEAAERWASRMQQAGENYRKGVSAVRVAPTERAAAAVDRYRQGINDAIESGRYERGLRSVTLQDWQKAALEVGAGRLGTGAAAAKGKVAKVFGPLFDHIEAGRQALPQRGGLDTNIQRAVQMMQHMAEFKKRG